MRTKNGNITFEKCQEIKQIKKDNPEITNKELSIKYGIAQSTICRIINGYD